MRPPSELPQVCQLCFPALGHRTWVTDPHSLCCGVLHQEEGRESQCLLGVHRRFQNMVQEGSFTGKLAFHRNSDGHNS